jgi:trigger factor
VKVTQDAIVDRQAVLLIDVDATELEEHLGRAYRRLVGRVAIPGFRKGKAPRTVFERQYGRDRLVEEALESLVPATVNKAVEEQGLEIASTPHVSVVERDPLPKLKATVPLKPIVELGDYKSIRVDDKPEAIADDRVQSVLDRVREGRATYSTVDRPVAMEDVAVLGAVDCQVEGRAVLTGKDTQFAVKAGSDYPAAGFAQQLEGMKAGESRSFTLTLPANFRDTAAAGKEGHFTVTVSEVREKALPTLDDEFAKSLNEGVDTLDQLRAKVRTELERQAAEAHRNVVEGKAIDVLVDRTKFEIPPLLIDHETEHMLVDQQEALARYRISFQDYMQSAGKTGDQVVNETREGADRRVRRALVLQELVRAEGVEVADSDVDVELERLRAGARTEQEKASVDTEATRSNVRSVLLRRRALQRLADIALSDQVAAAATVQEAIETATPTPAT